MKRYSLYSAYQLMRPTFYAFSPTYGRVSDLSAVIVQLLLLRARFPKNAAAIVLVILSYLFVQLFSLLLQSVNNVVIGADFISITYPLIAAVAFIFGAQVKNVQFALLFVQRLLVFGAILAIFQEHSGSIGIYLSQLYNTPALTVVGRFGGFSYTHTEHAAMCALGLALTIYCNSLHRIYRVFSVVIFTLSVLVPSSKAGVILYAIVIMLSTEMRYRILIVTVFSGVAIFFSNLLTERLPYLYYGFVALMHFDLADGSVGPRFEDWVIAFAGLTESVRDFLIGGGPRRFYDASYIEITSANILYRWGTVGFILYYYPLFYSLIRCYKKAPEISYFLGGLFIVDFAANFTESVKLFPILYYLYGLLLNNRTALSSSREKR